MSKKLGQEDNIAAHIAATAAFQVLRTRSNQHLWSGDRFGDIVGEAGLFDWLLKRIANRDAPDVDRAVSAQSAKVPFAFSIK